MSELFYSILERTHPESGFALPPFMRCISGFIYLPSCVYRYCFFTCSIGSVPLVLLRFDSFFPSSFFSLSVYDSTTAILAWLPPTRFTSPEPYWCYGWRRSQHRLENVGMVLHSVLHLIPLRISKAGLSGLPALDITS